MDYFGNYPVDIASNHAVVEIFKGTSQSSKEEDDKEKEPKKVPPPKPEKKGKNTVTADVVCPRKAEANVYLKFPFKAALELDRLGFPKDNKLWQLTTIHQKEVVMFNTVLVFFLRIQNSHLL